MAVSLYSTENKFCPLRNELHLGERRKIDLFSSGEPVRGELCDQFAFFLGRARLIQQIRGIQTFEEIGELLRASAPGSIKIGELLFKGPLLCEEGGLALLEEIAVEEPVYQRIRKARPPPGELAHLQFKTLAARFRLILPVCLHAFDLLPEVGPLLGVKLASEKERAHPPFGGFLPHARYLAGRRVAAVIGVALLRFADQGVVTGLAAHGAPEEEVVLCGPCRELAV